jgi:hypothetical protein
MAVKSFTEVVLRKYPEADTFLQVAMMEKRLIIIL